MLGLSPVHVRCANCSVPFYLEERHHARLVESHQGFQCPNGHTNHFVGKSPKERRIEELERDFARANQEVRSLQIQVNTLERFAFRCLWAGCDDRSGTKQSMRKHMESCEHKPRAKLLPANAGPDAKNSNVYAMRGRR